MRTAILVLAAACGAYSQTADGKTAEQAYKNIIVMKGTPSDQLGPAMQFIAASLGVQCSFCHVEGKFEADDKPAKKTARAMMEMTAAINQANFHGQRQVTCYSCHHGAGHPANMPPVTESEAAPVHNEARPPAASTATVDQILEKYTTAVGGADAMHKVTTRAEKGSIHAMGKDSPIELYTKAPNKRISLSQFEGGTSITAFDGTIGWLGTRGRPAREMSPQESSSAALDAAFYLPLQLKEMYPQMRRGRPEEIDGKPCDVLMGTAPGKPMVRLYFDSQSGLLVRMVRYAETSMGRMPVQIDYADYRTTDGVKIPYRWTLARPNGRFTIQIASVESNVPVDDAKFAKPAGEVK
ncbi:MAG TPA: c-type cytochrome [Bryobacteraceae bacterium]|nr:c-type cytochrome [Bryobacteraceae bacterium]